MPRIQFDDEYIANKIGDTYEVTLIARVTDKEGKRWLPKADELVQFAVNGETEPNDLGVFTNTRGTAKKVLRGVKEAVSYKVDAEIMDIDPPTGLLKGTGVRDEKIIRIEPKMRKIGIPNFDAEGNDGNWIITGVVPDENGQALKDCPVLIAITKEGRKEVETITVKTDSSDGYLRYRLVFTEPECSVRVRVGGYEKPFTLYGPPAHPRPPRYFLTRGEDEELESPGLTRAFRLGWRKGREALAKRAGAPEEELEAKKAALDKELVNAIKALVVSFTGGNLSEDELNAQSAQLREESQNKKSALERAVEGRGIKHAFKRGARRIGFSLASNNNWRPVLILAFALLIVLPFNAFVFGVGPSIDTTHSYEELTPSDLNYLQALYGKGADLSTLFPKREYAAWVFLRKISWSVFFFLLIWGLIYIPWILRDEFSRARRDVARHFRERTGSIVEGPTPQPIPTEAPSQPGQPSQSRGWIGNIANIGRRVRDDFIGSYIANWFTH